MSKKVKITSWAFGIPLFLFGCLFGFASAEEYTKILVYCISLEVVALGIFIFIGLSSTGKGKWAGGFFSFLCALVIAQAIQRLLF